ncbi:hypothetical protein [Caballeronia cordobensis]|uniref:hypothetical protein n=1 Tax=Caballeronia cordobensis TaxID=1353886 RepID=UPI0006AD66C4|nr:hypothetical protein [Caballeronia cordobensis]
MLFIGATPDDYLHVFSVALPSFSIDRALLRHANIIHTGVYHDNLRYSCNTPRSHQVAVRSIGFAMRNARSKV